MVQNPGIGFLVKQFQKMQDEIAKIKQELVKMKVTGSAGGGMLVATANGRQQIVDIKIDPELIRSQDIEMLEELIVVAVNQALERSHELESEHLSKATGSMLNALPGGLKIPGLDI